MKGDMLVQDVQAIRDFILRSLAKWQRGLPQHTLALCIHTAGIDLPDGGPDSLDAHLGYLADKGLVARATRAHTPITAHWRITSAGDDYLRETGLAGA